MGATIVPVKADCEVTRGRCEASSEAAHGKPRDTDGVERRVQTEEPWPTAVVGMTVIPGRRHARHCTIRFKRFTA